MFDKYKKRHRVSRVDNRLRRQIAGEAARRLISARPTVDAEAAANPADTLWLDAATESDFLSAKRKAVAVLGHRVRPSDLPSDDEVREQVLGLLRAGKVGDFGDDDEDEPDETEGVTRAADQLDRFTLYKMRLTPLEAVKQNPKTHPEGDALYHSLQVFERAKVAHPYDEEFLLAALLHDVGKAIDPQDHVARGVEALRGAVTDRTLWLIEHHMHLCESPKYRRPVDSGTPDLREDLKLLRELDDAGRVPGIPVGTVDEALDYLQKLDSEAFLEE